MEERLNDKRRARSSSGFGCQAAPPRRLISWVRSGHGRLPPCRRMAPGPATSTACRPGLRAPAGSPGLRGRAAGQRSGLREKSGDGGRYLSRHWLRLGGGTQKGPAGSHRFPAKSQRYPLKKILLLKNKGEVY